MSDELTYRRKLLAIYSAARYRPVFTVLLLGLSVFTAFLEGVGLSFILPIVEVARGTESASSGLMDVFNQAYSLIGIPFTMETLILGVSIIITVRYLSSFAVSWLKVLLMTDYERHIREQSYRGTLDATVEYFDRQGSDEIINAIITQSTYASSVIGRLVRLFQAILVSLVYLSVALYMSTVLTITAVVILGISTLISRNIFESGYSVGDRVAESNERIQETVQSGTQGIRDVKLFGMDKEIYEDFRESMQQYVNAKVNYKRNSAGIQNFNQLVSALSLFLLIYLAVDYASLTIGGLGVFLFAMFRLAPRVSAINDVFYSVEAELPHLVRAQEFINDIQDRAEPSGESEPPRTVESIEFEDVSFSYESSEQVLEDVSLQAQRGDFIAFVGESGAGKSTIVSLLARMYEPDSGEIRVNGTPIENFDLEQWRERVAVVRQHPFIFDDTLEYNLTIGHRDATKQELERVSRIARVDEFLDDLPNGFNTVLGDNGVRLSGGQKQRVALARALLKDADILVLDEATSDLDTNIEAEVQEQIESEDDDYITLTIAHRLSTVKNADQIYTVVDGEITAAGRHEDLLQHGGKYADLHSK